MIQNKYKIIMVCLFLGLAFVNVASAALVECGGRGVTGSQKPCDIPNLIHTITGIINFLLSWSALVAILYIVWAGWNMITAGGNEEAISAAKTTFSNAIIGFFMVMVSFVLLNFVVSLFTDGTFGPSSLINAFKFISP